MNLLDELQPPVGRNLLQCFNGDPKESILHSRAVFRGVLECCTQEIHVEIGPGEHRHHLQARPLSSSVRCKYRRLLGAVDPPKYIRISTRQMCGKARNYGVGRAMRRFLRFHRGRLDRDITGKCKIEAERAKKRQC